MANWETIEQDTSCETQGCDWYYNGFGGAQGHAAAAAAHLRKHPDHLVLSARTQMIQIKIGSDDA